MAKDEQSERTAAMARHYEALLALCGDDPSRQGLLKTPTRAAKALAALTRGVATDPRAILESAIFDDTHGEMVVVSDIEFFSLCEHHLLPFFGKAHVAYLPAGRIVGLSKIPRVVDAFARRLQVQERLTVQIRDCVQAALAPHGVAVLVEAQHMCMQMRGVEKHGACTSTTAYGGVFTDDRAARAEFAALCSRTRTW